MSLGAQLRALRERQGTSQRLLAEQTGLDHGDISRLENGRDARWSTIQRYLSGLGLKGGLALVEACDETEGLNMDLMEERRERQHLGPGGKL